MAESILQTLIEEGPKTLANPSDYDSRANIVWCATMALNGLIGVGVPQDWATHMVGHELTALYGLDHAQTLAVVLPSMMSLKRDAKRDKLLQYAERVWGITQGNEAERIQAAIDKTRSFFESVGVPTHLAAYQVGEEAVLAVPQRMSARGDVTPGEKGDIGADAVGKVLALSL